VTGVRNSLELIKQTIDKLETIDQTLDKLDIADDCSGGTDNPVADGTDTEKGSDS
jgi:hypothetical protein